MICSRVANPTEICDPLSPSESIVVEDLIDILQENDDATHSLDRTASRSIKDVEIFTATIICKLEHHMDKNTSLSSMTFFLKEDILSRQRNLFNEFPIVQLVLQVLILLTPKYCNSRHKKFLRDGGAYNMAMDRSIKILYKNPCFFRDDVTERVSDSGNGDKDEADICHDIKMNRLIKAVLFDTKGY